MTRAKLIAELSNVDVEKRLILGLDPLTYRDLREKPPGEKTTMAQVGIGSMKLDTVVRSWINRDFRKPNGKPALAPGAITQSTTWKKLLEMCQ